MWRAIEIVPMFCQFAKSHGAGDLALRPPLQGPSWQSSVLPVPKNSREREQTMHFPLAKSFANGIGRGALSGTVRLVCAALPQAVNYLAQPKRKPSRQETRQSNSPARLRIHQQPNSV